MILYLKNLNKTLEIVVRSSLILHMLYPRKRIRPLDQPSDRNFIVFFMSFLSKIATGQILILPLSSITSSVDETTPSSPILFFKSET